MKEIYEIRIHGRGGQGAKTASQIIAETALELGKYIQSFPEYGPERAGAPLKAYNRISDKKIKSFAPVTNPDVVLVIDPTLLQAVDVTAGTDEKSILIVNTPKSGKDLGLNFKGKIYTVDATKIALETVGKNLPNTPILGALIKITKLIPLDAIVQNVRETLIGKIGEIQTKATIDGIKRAYDEVK